jgi:23S rRNA (guanosine2251-2'-O)-methyltransferase
LVNTQRRWRILGITPEQKARLDKALPRWKPPAGTEVRIMPGDKLDALLGKQVVHQGIALRVSALPSAYPEDIPEVRPGDPAMLVVALDGVEDPGNLGGIIRTTATFGARALVMTERHAPPVSPVVMKAASGGVEYVPLVTVTNLVRTLEQFKRKGFWIMGLAEEGEQVLPQVSLDCSVVWVMGSEGSGLRALTRQACDVLVRLPTSPLFPTMNVGSALAVACYEWVRQQKDAPQGQ